MIDSISHTHTTWPSLWDYHSFSLKILHFPMHETVESNRLFAPMSISQWPSFTNDWHSSVCWHWEQRTLSAVGTFSLMCIFRCLSRLLLFKNFSWQLGQTNGFSPVWILRCENQFATLSKILITIWTDKRLFTRVDSKMRVQFATLFEVLITIMTDERLFTSMNSTMHIQIVTPFELLVTIRTDESLFTSVNYSMYESSGYSVWTSCHNQNRRTVFHQCESWNAQPKFYFVWISCHNQRQTKGFSLVWLILCVIKWLLCLNCLLTYRTGEWIFTSMNSAMHL